MKRILIYAVVFCVFNYYSSAQNKSGHQWIFGAAGMVRAEFTDTSRPDVKLLFPNAPYYCTQGHSNICDSATGRLLFSCNGMILYDSNGVIMENGDSLVPTGAYTHYSFPHGLLTQNSLILPKGSSGLHYVFVTTVSDSLYYSIWAQQIGDRFPYDLLMYHIVDMNANGGLGKVVEKNKVLLQHVELHKIRMQACRHHNGRDWWLLKQGRYGTNEIYRFLVKPDTILGPFVQTFPSPAYSSFDLMGQMAFSPDGTKFAMVHCKMQELFLAEFDRCSGELSNPKVVNIPTDSTGIPNVAPQYIMDSVIGGVCFSPNNNFVYVSKRYNIYQYEWNEPDSNLAWYRVQHGPDTTYIQFAYYNSLHNGPDGRIYIGNWGADMKQMSVIDHPDIKGAGAGFCRKCFRITDTSFTAFGSPPSLPDFNLGAASGTCWPLNQSESEVRSAEWVVYPNPSDYMIKVESKRYKDAIKFLYNSLGQLMLSTKENEIDVSGLHKGVYYLKCAEQTKKVVIE